MIQLGEIQELYLVKQTSFGVYLGEDADAEEDKILLPRKQVPKDSEKGDKISVFVYRDSEDRLIATTTIPPITLGKTAVLKVKEVGNIGAFLDWGLEKDLLLPFKEQTKRVHEGKSYLVGLYIDKSQRLCATMNVYEMLETAEDYQRDDRVTGIIYDVKDEFGAFVAVDNLYHGMIPKKEFFKNYEIGDVVDARVTMVREDGKLDLSIREKAHVQMDADSQMIMDAIKGYGGSLPFNDKADPTVIKEEFGLSKAAFKRAVGRLLKQGKIKITDNTIDEL